MGLLHGQPRAATVTCASDTCSVRSLSKEDFLKLMARSTALQNEMEGLASRRHTSNLDSDEQNDDAVKKMRAR